MSWYTVAMNLGMVLCPMVVTTIAASVFGPAIANCFMVGAIIVSVVAALSWFVPSLLKDCQLTID